MKSALGHPDSRPHRGGGQNGHNPKAKPTDRIAEALYIYDQEKFKRWANERGLDISGWYKPAFMDLSFDRRRPYLDRASFAWNAFHWGKP